ncbi:carboxylesterase/lipase family protein [Nocardioides pocheonensis]|uniref:Carboxylic ester hydrolase n=2 Tax=Nocardioides pocheonensis TaxID=661485 RepID=A0A3N0GY69_9ACTN|nr:carboxylesterase/lipase family protein [Nocardioides pocheonensis]
MGFRVVETSLGRVRGLLREGYAEFKGIAYGESTGGTNRFLPPKPARPWTGVRDALQLGPQSPQINPDFPAWLDSSEESEDCLVLNVWAPDHARAESALPVMVWLHGGGFVFGSAGAPLYDGGNVARDGDVVVVGVNHRLNAFGYTYLGDGADERFALSGNVGHLDLVAALEWVRDNISAFGGDADNVTIFGQSGGGGKVAALMATERAQGLFHKAIVMSGAIRRFRTPDNAAHVTARLYKEVGLREGDVESLQKVPAKTLAQFMAVLGDPLFVPGEPISLLKYGPVVDGHVLTEQSWWDGVPAFGRSIPMLIGITLQETAGGVGWFPGELNTDAIDDVELARRVSPYSVINAFDLEELVPVVGRYRQVMPDLSDEALLVRISTDIGHWTNALRMSSAKSDHGGAPIFSYECRWRTPCFGGMWSMHGVELPFVFNRPTYGVAWDGADSDAGRAAADPFGRRFTLGAEMFRAWINFARTGDPSTETHPWPSYDTTSRPTMVFGVHTGVENDVRGDVRPHVTSMTVE